MMSPYFFDTVDEYQDAQRATPQVETRASIRLEWLQFGRSGRVAHVPEDRED
jgi:hypothetical protein